MQKSLKSPDYARLIAMLVAILEAADMRQHALARSSAGPSHSLPSMRGERRLDVVEFITIVQALGADPVKVFRDFANGKLLPKAKRTK